MPPEDIAVLAGIVAAFLLFAVTLLWLSYESRKDGQ